MTKQQQFWFSHEKLEVYQEAIAFIAWVSALLESMTRAGDVKDQIDRASTSVVLNIAEGNGNMLRKIVAGSLILHMARRSSVPRRWMFSSQSES